MLMTRGPCPKRGPAGALPPLLRTMCRNLQQATCGQQAMQDVIIWAASSEQACSCGTPCNQPMRCSCGMAANPATATSQPAPPACHTHSWWLHWYRRRQKASSLEGGCWGGTPKWRQHRPLHSTSLHASGLQVGAAASKSWVVPASWSGRCRGAAKRGSSWARQQDRKQPCRARAAARTPRTSQPPTPKPARSSQRRFSAHPPPHSTLVRATSHTAGAPCIAAGGRQVEQVLRLVQKRGHMLHHLGRQRPPVGRGRRIRGHGWVAQRVLEAAAVDGQ